MTDCLFHVAANLKKVLTYSAWYFERMGQYQDCIADPQMNYNFVMFTVQDQQFNAGFMGLCLPKTCTTEQIKQSFCKLFVFAKLPLAVSHIENDVPNVRHEFSWVFFLTIILAISCIAFVFYASLWKPKNQLSAFSIQQSRKIFKLNSSSNLNILNGVRSLSMIWVVIGHAYPNILIGSLNIQSSVEKNALEKPFYLLIQGGTFAVDVFFFISGLLLAYVFLRDKQISWVKYPMAIVQRVLRIWPSYLFALMVYYSVYIHMGSGPMWGQDQEIVNMCKNMWRPIFFVDNFVQNGQKQCMNWGWYLQNDVQLFTMSIALLYIYRLKPIVMKVFIWPLIIGSQVFIFIWTFNHNVIVATHFSDSSHMGNFFADVYSKPWASFSPYFLGLFFGILHIQYEASKKKSLDITNFFLHKVTQFFEKSKIVRICCEWSGVVIIIFLVFIPRTLQVGMQWPQWLHSLYQSSAKFIFAFALYMILLPSLLGCKQSLMRFCLDTRFFNFIAKISFCTYLIHLTLIETWIYSRTYSQYYTNMVAWPVFCGILVASMFCGFLMTIVIEAPFSKLQKTLISFLKTKIIQIGKTKSISNEAKDHYNKLSETMITQDNSITEQTTKS